MTTYSELATVLVAEVERLQAQEQRVRRLHANGANGHMCIDLSGARVYYSGSMVCTTIRALDSHLEPKCHDGHHDPMCAVLLRHGECNQGAG
jgi:hypothetical protein